MISPILQAKIYSTLGNPSSLVPLAIKDITNSVGMTTSSFITGKEEGVDRFIDEFGTEALWLFGIPAYKGLFNITAIMTQGLDYNFDARNFRNPEITKLVQEYAPSDLQEKVKKVIANESKYKKLATSKFAMSVGLALATYIGLTKAKQSFTDKNIRKNILEEYQEEQKQKMSALQTKEEGTAKSPVFTGWGKVIQDFACDPVRNMWILDGGITSERLIDARGTQERIGYAFKEFSALFFMYYAGQKLQTYLENKAKKLNNRTIKFDARVIENPALRDAFEKGKIKTDLEAFSKVVDKGLELLDEKDIPKERVAAEEVEIYKFLHHNKDNVIVKTAMESDLIKEHKTFKKNPSLKDVFTFSLKEKTGNIDTRAYIDIADIKQHYKNLQTLLKEYETREASETSEQFFNTLKKLKRGAIRNNIGISMLAMGVIIPAIMVTKRLLAPGDKEFCRVTEIREKMIKEGSITA